MRQAPSKIYIRNPTLNPPLSASNLPKKHTYLLSLRQLARFQHEVQLEGPKAGHIGLLQMFRCLHGIPPFKNVKIIL